MFQGFSQQTFDFLWGVRLNNERSWFQEHKEEYLSFLYRPMTDLAADVQELVLARCPGRQFQKKTTRIYRDARRVKYGGPYKDYLWFSLERPHDASGDWHGEPAFWFEIRPEGMSYGFGYWGTPQDMERYRRQVQLHPEVLEKLVNRYRRQHRFCLEGECYKRPKGTLSPKLDPWFNRKAIQLSACEIPEEIYTSSQLAEFLAEGFLQLMPFYDYFDALRMLPPVTDPIR